MVKIGLDCSSSNTGYCIRDENDMILYGDISYKSKDFKVRCVNIVHQIKKICKDNKVEFIIFEDVQDGKQSHATKVLSFLQGCLVYMAESSKISYCPIPISCWRKSVGIKSRKREEQKIEAINLVKEKYRIDVSEDCAEAILISEFNNFK